MQYFGISFSSSAVTRSDPYISLAVFTLAPISLAHLWLLFLGEFRSNWTNVPAPSCESPASRTFGRVLRTHIRRRLSGEAKKRKRNDFDILTRCHLVDYRANTERSTACRVWLELKMLSKKCPKLNDSLKNWLLLDWVRSELRSPLLSGHLSDSTAQ